VLLIDVEGKGVVAEPQVPNEPLTSLTQPEAWQKAALDFQQALTGDRGLRSPVLVAVVLLIIAGLIALGFVLGLVVFSP
jgi:hypothetical protein